MEVRLLSSALLDSVAFLGKELYNSGMRKRQGAIGHYARDLNRLTEQKTTPGGVGVPRIRTEEQHIGTPPKIGIVPITAKTLADGMRATTCKWRESCYYSIHGSYDECAACRSYRHERDISC